MNRRLIVICAVLFLVAMAIPAFAAVQNVKVSGDIEARWIVRNNFALGNDTSFRNTSDKQNYLNSIARIRVDADLTDNVSATIRLLNERDWNDEGGTATTGPLVGASGDTAVDIDLAYVTLKEMLYSPLTVVIGRQNLRYGNAFIIGDPDTNQLAVARSGVQARDLSARKSFDAVRMILNYDPLTIDLIYSKVKAGLIRSNTTTTGNKDDMDLYGVNANYKLGDKYNTVAEAYFFSRTDRNTLAPEANGLKADTVYNPGLRVSTSPIKGLMLQGELAWQTGNKANASAATTTAVARDNRQREAMAWQILGDYAFQVEKLMKYAPMAGFEYSHFSGDKNPTTSGDTNDKGKFKEWDPMFEDQAGGRIYNVLFAAKDSNIYNAHISGKPIEDVTIRLDYNTLYLAQKLPRGASSITFGQTGGNTQAMAVTDGKKHLGQEIDGLITYDYTEDVQFALNAGVFYPGKVFVKSSANKNASQMIASCKVTF